MFNSNPIAAKSSGSHSSVKEVIKTLQYFLGVQLFCMIMMISFSFGGKFIFGVILGLPAVLAWAAGARKSYRFILYFLCIVFVVGQRTLYIGDFFRIVPSGALLWGLCLICLSLKSQYPLKGKAVPFSVVLLCLCSGLAVIIAYAWTLAANVNLSLFYAHMMWLSFPAFLVCYKLAQRLDYYKTILTIVALGCFFLSFLALSEYFNLGFISIFSGFLSQTDVVSQEGFKRLGASFWGGPMLAGFLTFWFPVLVGHLFASKTLVQKIMVALALTLSFLTIYFSGHRGLWIALLAGIAVYFYTKGIKGIFIMLIIAAVGIQFMPKQAITRMDTLSGLHQDTSAKKRRDRAADAIKMIKKDPIVGSGWGASGLVHSDLLQMYADGGLGVAFSFFLIFLQAFKRLFRIISKFTGELKEYGCGFFGGLVSSLVILAGQAWFNLPEQYTPFWVFVALAYHYYSVALLERKLSLQAIIAKKSERHKDA